MNSDVWIELTHCVQRIKDAYDEARKEYGDEFYKDYKYQIAKVNVLHLLIIFHDCENKSHSKLTSELANKIRMDEIK